MAVDHLMQYMDKGGLFKIHLPPQHDGLDQTTQLEQDWDIYHLESSNQLLASHPRWDHLDNTFRLIGTHWFGSLDWQWQLTQASMGINPSTQQFWLHIH